MLQDISQTGRDFSSWGAHLPYSVICKSTFIGSTSARSCDNRTGVSYYLTNDGYIVAS